MDAGESGEVVLEYEVELSETELVITYEVSNGTGETIWLTTPLTRVDESGKVVGDPQKVYTYVDPEGVLHITKRVWPVPEDMDVYRPEMPMLTEVRAGGRFGERVVVGVPVGVGWPYGRAVGGGEVGGVNGVAVSVGYGRRGEGAGMRFFLAMGGVGEVGVPVGGSGPQTVGP